MDLARSDGCTPAYIAAVGGHYDVIDVLGSKGANLRVANEDGLTPYDAATECPFRVQTLAALAAHGVRPPTLLSSLCGGLLCGSRHPAAPSRRGSSSGSGGGGGGGGSSLSLSAPRTSRLESDAPDVAEQGVKDGSVRDSISGI
jgi:hypothetical protein